jgi:hypothetical protein
MNMETRTEAVQYPEKEYINEIFVAVYCKGHNLDAKLSSKIAFSLLFSLWLHKTGVLIVYTHLSMTNENHMFDKVVKLEKKPFFFCTI